MRPRIALVLLFLITTIPALAAVPTEPASGEQTEQPKPGANTSVASQANNQFAMKLFSQINANGTSNVFISPFSVSQAMGMLLDGARGETLAEMRQALAIPQNLSNAAYQQGTAAIAKGITTAADDPATVKMRQQLAALEKELAAARKKGLYLGEKEAIKKINALTPQLDTNKYRLANSIWLEKTYPVSPTYVQGVHKYYGTGKAYLSDFQNQPDICRLQINRWVEQNTENKIKNILLPGSITPLTRLVVANAIYFKGDWFEPFEERQTKDKEFTLSSGEKINTPTMMRGLEVGAYAGFNDDGSFFETPDETYHLYQDAAKRAAHNATAPGETRTAEELLKEAQDLVAKMNARPQYPGNGGFQVARIPYRGKKLAMLLFVPIGNQGANACAKKLTSQVFANCRKTLEKRDVNLELVKFKMEQTVQLNDSLRAMGIKEAFTTQADFSGIRKDNKKEIFISTAIHKTFVEVNEKGTEAAAATIFAECSSAAPRMNFDFKLQPLYYTQPFTPECKTSRPFLFFIVERSYGTILFAGKIEKP